MYEPSLCHNYSIKVIIVYAGSWLTSTEEAVSNYILKLVSDNKADVIFSEWYFV